MKRLIGAGLALTLVSVSYTTALAGDPNRYVDRHDWPLWSTTYFSDVARDTPIDGELVDAIRYELIRGYPVTATDELGYEDREFRFEQPMTRAEFATVLSRSQGLGVEDGAGAEWFVPHVTALTGHGVIPSDASQDWAAPISRREAGQWMGRAAGAFGADDNASGMTFADVDDPLILRALRAGIVKGTGEGRYEPDRALLRVEAAVMLLRLARARNSAGNADNPAVIEALQNVVREADRQAAVRGKKTVDQGYLEPPELGGVLTQELADQIWYRSRANLQARGDRPLAWTESPADSYRFTVSEAHDTIAELHVCAHAVVYSYELGDENHVFFEQDYCERQFLVLLNGQWLIAGAR
ncbi:MAG TPA: S-layer homology domain-containing protein [Symbiobacteriaceae bacterium]|nr:S-layer homology domain-containing protein [Symbiobacteriaceae bacterium]